jgi:hypothetical protein
MRFSRVSFHDSDGGGPVGVGETVVAGPVSGVDVGVGDGDSEAATGVGDSGTALGAPAVHAQDMSAMKIAMPAMHTRRHGRRHIARRGMAQSWCIGGTPV